MAHRVAWLWMTGEWPDGDIDHIDGDGHNNRWSNLRCVSRSVNALNGGAYRTNALGVRGVYHKGPRYKTRPFCAEIMVDGKKRHLGMYATIDEASAAYQAVAQKAIASG